MRIPYVIDNIEHQLGGILDGLLRSGSVDGMDIATAYFSIRGYQQLRQSLPTIRKLRLLLGDEPTSAEDIGTRPDFARLSAAGTQCRTAHARNSASGRGVDPLSAARRS